MGAAIMSGKENLPLSIMARKFLNAESFREVDPNLYAFRKELYFFYGTLMDPATLAKVLNLPKKPVLQPAKITGYRCMLWGPYPALLDDLSGGTVHGMAYEVQSPKEAELLEAYETNHYRNTACLIELEHGTKVRGRTFKWNAEKGDLEEGVFSLKDWRKDNL